MSTHIKSKEHSSKHGHVSQKKSHGHSHSKSSRFVDDEADHSDDFKDEKTPESSDESGDELSDDFVQEDGSSSSSYSSSSSSSSSSSASSYSSSYSDKKRKHKRSHGHHHNNSSNKNKKAPKKEHGRHRNHNTHLHRHESSVKQQRRSDVGGEEQEEDASAVDIGSNAASANGKYYRPTPPPAITTAITKISTANIIPNPLRGNPKKAERLTLEGRAYDDYAEEEHGRVSRKGDKHKHDDGSNNNINKKTLGGVQTKLFQYTDDPVVTKYIKQTVDELDQKKGKKVNLLEYLSMGFIGISDLYLIPNLKNSGNWTDKLFATMITRRVFKGDTLVNLFADYTRALNRFMLDENTIFGETVNKMATKGNVRVDIAADCLTAVFISSDSNTCLTLNFEQALVASAYFIFFDFKNYFRAHVGQLMSHLQNYELASQKKLCYQFEQIAHYHLLEISKLKKLIMNVEALTGISFNITSPLFVYESNK